MIYFTKNDSRVLSVCAIFSGLFFIYSLIYICLSDGRCKSPAFVALLLCTLANCHFNVAFILELKREQKKAERRALLYLLLILNIISYISKEIAQIGFRDNFTCQDSNLFIDLVGIYIDIALCSSIYIFFAPFKYWFYNMWNVKIQVVETVNNYEISRNYLWNGQLEPLLTDDYLKIKLTPANIELV